MLFLFANPWYYIDNIINLSVSLPLEQSDCEKRRTGGKDWVI